MGRGRGDVMAMPMPSFTTYFSRKSKTFAFSPGSTAFSLPPPPSPPHPRVYVYPPYIFFLLGFSLFFITFGQPFTTHILTL